MPRELKNAQITHVSYVDKGANQKRFFLTKSANDNPTFQKQVKVITKADDEKKLVYGVVYEPDVADAHDDVMTAEEIEKAAHNFLKDARNIDTQHDFDSGAGDVVESYVAPADISVGEETIIKGSWVLVTKASDEIWESIQKGEITGYSMAGTAETEDVVKSNEPSTSNEEAMGFFNLVKNFFSGKTDVQKGQVRDKYEQNVKRRNLWAVWDGLESEFYESIWENRTVDVADFERLQAAVQDFMDIIQEIQETGEIQKALEGKPEKIQKAGKKISTANMDQINAAIDALQTVKNNVSEEEEEVKKEDFEKLLDEKLSPITKRLDEIEKEEEPTGDEGGPEDVVKQLGEVLDSKLQPITKRLEAVEKTRGISKQEEIDEKEEEVKKSEGSVWNGLI